MIEDDLGMMEDDLGVMEDNLGMIEDDLGVMEDDLLNLFRQILSYSSPMSEDWTKTV